MPQSDHPELGSWSQVEPPAALDALVRQRVTAVLERRRTEEAPPPVPAHLPVPAAQRPGYPLTLMAYAAQLADSAARLIWRAGAG
jgi:hypothetical protein